MEIITDYLIFLLKVFTIALAITIPLLIIIGSSKNKSQAKGKLSITNLSDKFEEMGNAVKGSVMNPKDLKKFNKEISKDKKKKDKNKDKDKDNEIDSVFVLNFKGDIQASEVEKLKQEVNAILLSNTECKEVVIRVESGGGSAYAYGLCAAELKRLVDNEINLTVCIDKVAASGGYLMSCVATKIIAAPWAIV
jgi:serine protease SohB